MTGPSPRSLMARWAAPLLLVVVAVVQIVRVHTVDQSPWSGAGFGMFAVIDGEDTRWVRGMLTHPGGESEAIWPPRALSDLAFEARVVPSEERVRTLARRWADLLDTPGALVVEVWGPRYSHDPPTLGAELLAVERVEVDAGA